MAVHRNAYLKLLKLWDLLALPAGGPSHWTGSRRDQCARQTVEKAQRKGMNEETVRSWAHAIHQHCKGKDSTAINQWLGQLIDKRTKSKNDDTEIPLGARLLTITQVLQILQDAPSPSLGPSAPDHGGKSRDWREWTWYQLLVDRPQSYQYQEDAFDFLFGLTDAVPQAVQHTGVGRMAQSGPNRDQSDAIQNVTELWPRSFSFPSTVRAQWLGHFLLTRVDVDHLRLTANSKGEEEASSAPFGWFGTQRVLVVPVKIEVDQGCLKWTDKFPDPVEGRYDSEALLERQNDNTVEIWGFDTLNPSVNGKFIAVTGVQRFGAARGIMFARTRTALSLEAYRFWLKRVDEEEYDLVAQHVDDLNRQFASGLSAREKRKRYNESDLVLKSVADSLSNNERAMIYYLFAPFGMNSEDELETLARVKRIRPHHVGNVILTARLGTREN